MAHLFLLFAAGLLLQDISAAIKNTANATTLIPRLSTPSSELTTLAISALYNPGASILFGTVKFSIDVTGYTPAGYLTDHDPTQFIRGLSPLHSEIMPQWIRTTSFARRQRLCKLNTDRTFVNTLHLRMIYLMMCFRPLHTLAFPGYFAQTLNNNMEMEATATRRAGLERFTFPEGLRAIFRPWRMTSQIPLLGVLWTLTPEKGGLPSEEHRLLLVP
ncbi:hypothetical protein R3P38DRAFT_3197615 [Favolaschia claudopus]|uniref:Glycosyl hydrolase family 92 N-terminal domain-containing protein n=1 Tax=Favolaschia claudopus TaxID=2862362 RepID=A0AAW0B418_9AGAR